MNIPGEISSFSAQPADFTNGAENVYTFSIQASILVIPGDILSFTLPAEVGAPSEENVQ
jgi:hypothetical protein